MKQISQNLMSTPVIQLLQWMHVLTRNFLYTKDVRPEKVLHLNQFHLDCPPNTHGPFQNQTHIQAWRPAVISWSRLYPRSRKICFVSVTVLHQSKCGSNIHRPRFCLRVRLWTKHNLQALNKQTCLVWPKTLQEKGNFPLSLLVDTNRIKTTWSFWVFFKVRINLQATGWHVQTSRARSTARRLKNLELWRST